MILGLKVNQKKKQEGVAAVEFALVITILLLICFAIVSYGMLMWTQQKVSHLAGDSARVALQRSIQGHAQFGSTNPPENEDAFGVCKDHAKVMAEKDFILSGLVDAESCKSKIINCDLGGVSGRCLQLTMKFEVSNLPLVNLVKTLGELIQGANPDAWIPQNLSATSIVKITEL